MEQLSEHSQLLISYRSVKNELSKVFVGHDSLVDDLFCSLVCGGHVLIEGVPGLGKTHLVKALGRILNLDYSRIQFTPDLMPADIIGTNIVKDDESGNRRFEFYKGPVFGQLILADEINRATPKTQSALLEAMQEHNVTVFGTEYKLQRPFMVLATQNPMELEGTYPLPEAQIDRFFFKLKVLYPNSTELEEIIDKTTEDYQAEIEVVMNADMILACGNLVRKVPIASHVKKYAIRLVLATHPDNDTARDSIKEYVRYGASPRGIQTMVLAAKMSALLDGRSNVAFEDIRKSAKPALRHRIIRNMKGEAEAIDPDFLIDEILRSTSEATK